MQINRSGQVGIGRSPGYRLDVAGDARFTGDINADSNITLNGSTSKLVVMNGQDGGGKGIYLQSANDSNFGLYMASSGAGKSLGGGTAVAGQGFTQQSIRFRVGGGNTSGTYGFVWENSADQLLMSLRGSDGYMWVRGSLTVDKAPLKVTTGVGETNALTLYHGGEDALSNGLLLGFNNRGNKSHIKAGLFAEPSSWGRSNLHFVLSDTASSEYDSEYVGDVSYSKMCVLSNGNVGISTVSPSEKLHVASGNVLVQSGHVQAIEFIGNLTATEATIDTLSASNANLIIDEVSLGVSNVLVYADEDGLLSPSGVTYDGVDLTASRIIATSQETASFHAPTCTSTGYNMILTGGNDTGYKLVCFVNGSARTVDGGVDTVTIRNDNGPIRFGYNENLTTLAGSALNIETTVGIGTSSPAYTLDCRGTIYSNDKVYVDNGNGAPPAVGTLGGTGTRLVLYPGDTTFYPYALGIDNDTMWYGTSNPNAYHRWYGGGTQMMYLQNSNLSVIGNITAYASDARLKENTKPLTNILDRVQKLQGYAFTWKEGVGGLTMTGADVGLLAQDVEDAGFPEAITLAPFDTDNGVSKSGFNYKTIHYNKLHAVWASSVNALHQKIQEQDQKILEQHQQILDLEQRLARLEALLGQAP
jgi:hypothetical protein